MVMLTGMVMIIHSCTSMTGSSSAGIPMGEGAFAEIKSIFSSVIGM